MSVLDVAMRTRIASVDNNLAQLARDMRQVKGEYAAEAATLEQIDELLDRRLKLTGDGRPEAAS
ncbi:MAG: hypothetical protein GEV04_22175 [Actinophytocola sp.]|nr:hypothetical protein [Actinophytocola sp.]